MNIDMTAKEVIEQYENLFAWEQKEVKQHIMGNIDIKETITDIVYDFQSVCSKKDSNMKKLSVKERTDKILQRADARNKLYKLLYKFVAVCEMRGLRMIFENPWNTNDLHYLKNNFLKEPTIVDLDRTRRGDYFVKPTGYWFFNCTNTFGSSFQKPRERKRIKDLSGSKGGLCNTERSMISPDYARNFICDFIIGKQQIITQTNLFD